MALISTKGMYGLAALCEIKKHNATSPIHKHEIAKRASVSENYLDLLLGKLKKAGIVKSLRGVNGGYILAKDPKMITVVDVLIALEDDLKVVKGPIEHPILELFFRDAKDKINDIFNLNLLELEEYQNDVLDFVI